MCVHKMTAWKSVQEILSLVVVFIFILVGFHILPSFLIYMYWNEYTQLIKMHIKYYTDPNFRRMVDQITNICSGFSSTYLKSLCVDLLTDVPVTYNTSALYDLMEEWGVSPKNIQYWDCSAVSRVQLYILSRLGIPTKLILENGHVCLENGLYCTLRQGVI